MRNGIDYSDSCKTDLLYLGSLHHSSIMPSTVPTTTLDCLPYSILSNICAYLHQDELLNFSLTSKTFYLQLHMKELYTKNELPNRQRRLLDLITEYTPALQSLDIKPTSDDLCTQHYVIVKALRQSLVHQLKNLLLVFESATTKQSLEINSTICHYQHNLENLLILDRSTAVIDSEFPHCCLSSDVCLLSLYDHDLIYKRLIISLLFSDVLLTDFLELDERFVINDHMLGFIQRVSDKELNDFLWSFLNYTCSSVSATSLKLVSSLPAIKILNVLGISLVVRHDNISLKNILQGLYYNTNKIYLISCGSTY